MHLPDSASVPSTQLSCVDPQIIAPVPVLILSTAKLCLQHARPSLGRAVQGDSLLEETPATIDHLSARLDFEDLATRKLVADKLAILGSLPDPLLALLHALFAMHNSVVNHAGNLQLVCPGRVRVEHHLPVLQVLSGDVGPLEFSNGPWAGGAPMGQLRFQLDQHQCFRTTALHNSTPLLPHDALALVALEIFGDVLLVESRFVCFDVSPFHTKPKLDLLLLLTNP